MTHAPDDTAPELAGQQASYAAAGVDVEAGERAVDRLKPLAKSTSRPEVLGGIGGFAGLFALRTGKYREPVLAASTDGVGTKLAVAQAADRHDTVGRDLVAMVVDDLVVCGAEPLFLQDYLAIGKLVPEKVEKIVSGIAEGCRLAGCALLGGETAEHPGVMEPHHYDLSATGVGIVEADGMLGPDRVRPGDTVVAMGSSGLHSNGYSLARQVLLEIGRMSLDGHVEEFGRTLGDELLEPTRIYARDCLAVAAETDVRTFAHVTGGGLSAEPGPRDAGRPDRRARPLELDPGSGVQAHRLAGTRHPRRDGAHLQHGRRDDRRAAARRRRPRHGRPHGQARAVVGDRRGAGHQRGRRRGAGCRTRPAPGRPPSVLSRRRVRGSRIG